MAEDRDRLPQLLIELRSQLAASTSLDADTRRRLETTIDDVDRVLAGRPPKSARAEPLARRLGDATVGFEASHPNLAVTLSGIIDALGNLGI